MEIYESVIEMKQLERRLTYMKKYDGFDETRSDFSRWKGIYETWKRRKEAYRKQYKSMTRQRLCVFSRLTEYGRQSAEVIN